MAYPHVHNMADAGEVMLGPVGREVFGIAQMLFLVFVMGSHVLTFSIMMNTITNHGTCSIVFGFIGHVAFFSFISELHTPSTYPRALFLLQGCDTIMYLTVSVVIYRYAGASVTSPALGSTSPPLPKVAYGIAIPTIVIAGVINGHVAAKYVYVRLFRGTDRMSKRSWGSFGLWAIIVVILWIAAWIIAEAIPVFNDLLALISALFASWFTYGLSGVFWLFLNKGRHFSSPRKIFLTILNAIIFCCGAAICGLGLYASGKAIHADATSSNGSFSCADNSKSSA
ncbi:MAG: hypothetical protein Q9163_001863 [Psora crenata]